jgi:hypothetical protein
MPNTEFGDSLASLILFTTLQVVRALLVMVVLLALNVASIFAFQSYMTKKSKLRVGESKQKDLCLKFSSIILHLFKIGKLRMQPHLAPRTPASQL